MMLARFPEHEETIRLLFHFDDDFKSLCEDYHTSQLNIHRFRTKAFQDKANEQEYKSLSEVLEHEIIVYLKNRE